MILETTFTTATGRVRIVDFMPVRSEAIDLVRIVEGVEGIVKMRMDLAIRFDYGYQLTPIEGLVVNGEPQTRHWRIHISIGQAF